jgi:hypothetical protein
MLLRVPTYFPAGRRISRSRDLETGSKRGPAGSLTAGAGSSGIVRPPLPLNAATDGSESMDKKE